MALKSILKNSEAGPSRPRQASGKSAGAGARKPSGAKGGPKASFKAAVAAPKGKKAVKVVKPKKDDSDEDMDDSEDEGDDELDTEDEIERAQAGEEKKPQKRKRVTTAVDFGNTLASLLSESSKPAKKRKDAATGANAVIEPQPEAPKPKLRGDGTAPILSLSAKPLPPSAAAERLERRAARTLKAEQAARLDRARIRDVVEGWVPAAGLTTGSQEFERGLRKTAQRGVIKLFNAILVASKNAEAAATTLSAQAGLRPEEAKNRKERDNVIGRGAQAENLTKESFLDLVRKGGAK